MGNVLGIISEYNPFHNGHLYHLNESKRLTNSDYTIAIMTGNFTQRGDVSIIDKWSKTKMALENGIDLVIELPTVYAISSAENFATGAIKILNSLNIVDYISFGSECENIDVLKDISNVLCNEPKEYKTLLSLELSKGISFPKARERALMLYLNNVRRFANVISAPNNILGIEYLKALEKQKSKIKPICIKRRDSMHNDNLISLSSQFASGSAIRKQCSFNDISLLNNVMPTSSFNILNENIKKGTFVNNLSSFDKEIIYTLRKMSIEEIANLPDVSEGLEYSIKSAADSCNSVIELLSIVDSKRYTKTRLQRILLYAIIGITKKDIQLSQNINPYIRILGFNNKGRDIISEVSDRSPKIELVTSVKKFINDSNNKNLKHLINKDIWSTNIYTLGYEYESKSNLDFTQKLITY